MLLDEVSANPCGTWDGLNASDKMVGVLFAVLLHIYD
jgi:hypothetical protein